jgi:hypothetical protein
MCFESNLGRFQCVYGENKEDLSAGSHKSSKLNDFRVNFFIHHMSVIGLGYDAPVNTGKCQFYLIDFHKLILTIT